MSHITNKKKAQKVANNRLRGFNGFNTGERIMKSAKYPDRQELKSMTRRTVYEG